MLYIYHVNLTQIRPMNFEGQINSIFYCNRNLVKNVALLCLCSEPEPLQSRLAYVSLA